MDMPHSWRNRCPERASKMMILVDIRRIVTLLNRATE